MIPDNFLKIFFNFQIISSLQDYREYKEKKNSIPNRIVSLSQPYIRPIVRGKAKFGAKIDMSIDENGMARVEKMSFDAYNESDVLIGALQRYRNICLTNYFQLSL